MVAIASASAEHQHFLADDLGGVAVFSVPVLPFAGLQAAFDADGFTFCKVFASYFREACPQRNVVPFRLFFPFATFVLELLAGGQGETCNRGTGSRISDFRVFP